MLTNTNNYQRNQTLNVPATEVLVLVPLNTGYEPSTRESLDCIVIDMIDYRIRRGGSPTMAVFTMSHASDVPFLSRTSDILYPAPHNFVRAQRGYLNWEDYFQNFSIFQQPPPPPPLLYPEYISER